jgi:hypothetical protein
MDIYYNRMKYTTLDEINSNPIYQPPSEWLVDYKISNMIKDFFLNPTLLSSKDTCGASYNFSNILLDFDTQISLTPEERDKMIGNNVCNHRTEYVGEFYNLLKRLDPKAQKKR